MFADMSSLSPSPLSIPCPCWRLGNTPVASSGLCSCSSARCQHRHTALLTSSAVHELGASPSSYVPACNWPDSHHRPPQQCACLVESVPPVQLWDSILIIRASAAASEPIVALGSCCLLWPPPLCVCLQTAPVADCYCHLQLSMYTPLSVATTAACLGP